MEQSQALPLEYQQYLANIERRKALAAALMERNLGGINTPQQYTPGPYSQAIPKNPLAMALRAYAARQQRGEMEGADKEKQDFLSGYSAGERGELEQLNAAAADPKGDLARFLAHPMPRVAAQAAAEQKRRREEAAKLRKDAADVTAKRDPQAAIGMLTGQVAPDGYQFPPLQQPKVEPVRIGQDDFVQVTNYGEDNVPRATITAPPSRVSVSTGVEKEATKNYFQQLPKTLDETTAAASRARDGMSASQRIFELAGDPTVSTGAFATPELFVKNVAAKWFGTDPEGPAKTQQLLSLIQEQTLDASIDLKGAITEKEWPRLAQARAGEISYTPAALQTLAAIALAKNHNQWLDAVRRHKTALSREGAEQFEALYPLPRYGQTRFDPKLFEELPNGHIRFKGSVEPLFQKTPTAPTAEPKNRREELLKKYGG